MAFDTLQVKPVEGLLQLKVLQIRSSIDQLVHHQHDGVCGKER